MAMSTFWSPSGSSSSWSCIDHRHLLRRMAQLQASGTHLLSSIHLFQWNCHIDTKMSPIAESICFPAGVQMLFPSLNGSSYHTLIGESISTLGNSSCRALFHTFHFSGRLTNRWKASSSSDLHIWHVAVLWISGWRRCSRTLWGILSCRRRHHAVLAWWSMSAFQKVIQAPCLINKPKLDPIDNGGRRLWISRVGSFSLCQYWRRSPVLAWCSRILLPDPKMILYCIVGRYILRCFLGIPIFLVQTYFHLCVHEILAVFVKEWR